MCMVRGALYSAVGPTAPHKAHISLPIGVLYAAVPPQHWMHLGLPSALLHLAVSQPCHPRAGCISRRALPQGLPHQARASTPSPRPQLKPLQRERRTHSPAPHSQFCIHSLPGTQASGHTTSTPHSYALSPSLLPTKRTQASEFPAHRWQKAAEVPTLYANI